MWANYEYLTYIYVWLLFMLFIVMFLSSFKAIKHNVENYKMILCLIMFSIIVTMLLFYCLYYSEMFESPDLYMSKEFMLSRPVILGQMFISMMFLFVLVNLWCNININSTLHFGMLMLMLFCFFSSLMLITVNNLFILYLLIELQSFGLYLLVGCQRHSYISTSSGLKYFVNGSVASCILILGISFIYGCMGSVNITDIMVYLSCALELNDWSNLLVVGLLFILGGLFFKVGLFPFHGWLPKMYEEGSLIVMLFLSIMPKMPIMVVFHRMFGFIVGYFEMMYPFNIMSFMIIFSSLLSMFMGTVGGLYQTTVKGLIAYSTMANFGFVFLSMALGSFEGILASIFFILNYSLGVILLFSMMSMVKNSFTYSPILKISELYSMANYNSMLGLCAMMPLLSLAGVPPFPGFLSKLLMLRALWDCGSVFMFFFLMLISIVSTVYYMRMMRMIFFSEASLYSGPVSIYINGVGFECMYMGLLYVLYFWFIWKQLFIYEYLSWFMLTYDLFL